MSKKDLVLERQFVNNYLSNGRNGTQAYIKASPGVTIKSASVLATKMLARVSVIEAMDKRINDAEGKSKSKLPSKSDLVNRLQTIDKAAFNENQFGSSVNSVREQGKLLNLYEESDDGHGYITLIQNILGANVQVNIEQPKVEQLDEKNK